MTSGDQWGEAVGLCVRGHARWITGLLLRVSAHRVMQSAEEREWKRWQRTPHQSPAPTEAPHSAERFTPPTNQPSFKQPWPWLSHIKSLGITDQVSPHLEHRDHECWRHLHPLKETLQRQLVLRDTETWRHIINPCGHQAGQEQTAEDMRGGLPWRQDCHHTQS